MSKMRAKMKVVGVREQFGGPEHAKSAEELAMNAVCASSYPSDGSDEDNTFARWTPNAGVNITIANPALFGKFKLDDVYYVDFTPADVPLSVQLLDATEVSVESEIVSKGLTAPRVTPQHIDEVIQNTEFYVFPGTTLTVCCLTLRNGFTVLGESACASPENFNAELGQKIAKANAREKIWALEGYALRERMSAPVETD